MQEGVRHNHMTRVVLPRGECPACDLTHTAVKPYPMEFQQVFLQPAPGSVSSSSSRGHVSSVDVVTAARVDITDTDMWQLGRVAALRIKAGRGRPGDAEVLADAFEILTRYVAGVQLE